MKEENWYLSGFVAALKFLSIKLTRSISVLLLVIAALGCGRGEQTRVNVSNNAIVESIDRVAAAEFKELVEKHKSDIVRILEQNGILPANMPNPYKHINWHLYKSANIYIENGMGTAKIILSGWERSEENNYQNPFVLWFERKNRSWYLIVKGGHLTTAVSSSNEAHDLSPEIHEAFTSLFPHIEYEDWRKWKDPVRKKLALIRLKTTLPQHKRIIIQRKDAKSAKETNIMKEEDRLSNELIGAAIEVHRHLGPGLLESAYEECLCKEFSIRDIAFERQKPLAVVYKGTTLDCGYKLASV